MRQFDWLRNYKLQNSKTVKMKNTGHLKTEVVEKQIKAETFRV